MISCMERIRVYFDADEALKQALKQAALNQGTSVSAFIEQALTEKLGDAAMDQAAKVVKQREGKPTRKPPRPARDG